MSLLLVIMCVRLVGAFVPLQAPRGVVSFELDGVLFDARAVRDGVRGELQPWLASQLSATPPDAQEMMDAVRAAGAEFGMMMPGVRAIQREATKKTIASAGADEDDEEMVNQALAVWLQAFDSWAEQTLAADAVATIEALRERGFGCCAVTAGLGDSERMPSLAPLLDFTLSTCDFTVPAADAWDVALQVAPAKYERGRSWIHVGGATEGGLAPAAKAGLKTVALGDATAPDATARIARLSELPDAIDGLVAA